MQITTKKQLDDLNYKKRVYIVTENTIRPSNAGDTFWFPNRLIFTDAGEAAKKQDELIKEKRNENK